MGEGKKRKGSEPAALTATKAVHPSREWIVYGGGRVSV